MRSVFCVQLCRVLKERQVPCVLVHLVSRKKTIVRGNLTPGVHMPVRASRLLFQDNRHLAMDNKELLLENKRLNAELQQGRQGRCICGRG